MKRALRACLSSLAVLASSAHAIDLSDEDRPFAVRLFAQVSMQSCIRTVQTNRAAIEREKRIEKVSGSRDEEALRQAGSAIVDCETEIRDAYQVYRDWGGQRSFDQLSKPRTIVLNAQELDLLGSMRKGLAQVTLGGVLVQAVLNGAVKRAEDLLDGGSSVPLLPEQMHLRARASAEQSEALPPGACPYLDTPCNGEAVAEPLRAQEQPRQTGQMQIPQEADENEEEARAALELERKRSEWVAVLGRRLQKYWIRPPSAAKEFECEVEVELLPDGTVINARVASSCGDAKVDRSVQDAVYRSSPLPRPGDKRVFDRNLSIHFTPGR